MELYRPLPTHLRLVLAFVLGACMPLAFSPTDMVWLGVAALGGWFLLVWQGTHSFWIGWLFGLGWFGIGAFFLVDTFYLYGGVPRPMAMGIVLLIGAVLGLFPALWAWVSVRLVGQSHAMLLLFPVLAVVIEWLRGHVFTGLPWTALGNLVLDTPVLGWASMLGVYGVTWFPVALGCFAAALFVRGAQKHAGIGLAVLLLLGVFTPDISEHTDAQSVRHVAVIQGNIPQDQKWDAAFLQQSMQRYVDLSSAVAEQVDVILWPEAAVPLFLEDAPHWRAWLLEHMQSWHTPVLFGGLKQLRADDGQVPDAQNGLYLYQNSMPSELAFVGKQHLVPFGEYVPAWIPWLHKLVPNIANFQPATDGGVLHYAHEDGEESFGVLICYESIFPEEARERVLAGAQTLVVVTNDAWYGKSPAAWQHLQAARMRAVETGRYVLRAGNTGVSAVITPGGQLAQQIPWWQTMALLGEYVPRSELTSYVRWGDMPILLVCILMIWIAIRRREET